MTQHPLLVRLLRRVGASAGEAPTDAVWRELLALLSRTYADADQDRYTLERSIDISSREMQGLYQDLKARSESALAIERRRVETHYAMLRATLESAVEGILVVDTERRVIAANRRFGELFGLADEVMRAGDHAKIVEAAMWKFRAPEATRARIEELHASTETSREELGLADGRLLDWFSAPVRLPDGAGVGRVAIFRDVTAERAQQRQLEHAREAAEAASQAKSMFLANMSHELRTPLNAVIGLADLLLLERADPLTARQREYLEGVTQSGRHLLALVNDVLDLSKIEAGKHDLELEAVDARDAIEEAVAAIGPLARQRGVELTSASAVVSVRADRVRLRQILDNLISNAVKFTDRGGRVHVTGEQRGGAIAIAVVDTGIGIAPEDLPRLYRAFEQLELPTGDRPPGTGLGLALTKRLVEMHDGAIEVTSERGVGSTFTVRIPEA